MLITSLVMLFTGVVALSVAVDVTHWAQRQRHCPPGGGRFRPWDWWL